MRFYRLLLLAFPPAFRRRFGDDMAAVFEDRRRAARRRGAWAAATLWHRTVVDTIRHGLAERRAAGRGLGTTKGTAFMWQPLIQDVRFALRTFAARPTFTAVAIVTLALGIGANVAVFSAVRAVLIEDLPYPDHERIVTVSLRSTQSPSGGLVPSIPVVEELQRGTGILSALTAGVSAEAVLTGSGDAELVNVRQVSRGFWQTAALTPLAGRLLADDDFVDPARVVLISDRFWAQNFGRNPAAIGHSIRLDGVPRLIVGVVPNAFDLGMPDVARRADVFEPLIWTNGSGSIGSPVMGRLVPGLTPREAETRLNALLPGLPIRASASNPVSGFAIEPLADRYSEPVRQGLLLLQAIAGLLLLTACAGLASLFLADAISRQPELGVRAALGASRGRLMRQRLTEAAVLAMAGGAAGVAVAWWGVPSLVAAASWTLPRADEVGVRLPELAAGLGAALVTVLVFAVVPAVLASRADLVVSLRGTSHTSAGRAARVYRHTLVVMAVTLSVVMLAVAGLLIRSFVNVTAVPLGFDARDLVLASVRLPWPEYSDQDRRFAFAENLETELRERHGFIEVALGEHFPYTGGRIGPAPLPEGTQATPLAVPYRVVSPDYFRTFAIPLVRGRFFDRGDRPGSEPVVIVNEQFVEDVAPGRNLMGARLGRSGATVIGVVGNTRTGDVRQPPRPAVYWPLGQQRFGTLSVAVRASGASVPPERAIRDAVRSVDLAVPVSQAGPVEARIRRSQAQLRFYLLMLTLFAGLGATLAAGGIYGVVAHATRLRRREVGIRLALGARPMQVNGMVVRQTLRPIVTGVALGLTTSWWLTGWLAANAVFSAQLFRVEPHDPGTMAGAAGALLLVGVIAAWLPARRAGQVSPVAVLKAD